MKKIFLKNESGVTLIELLVGLSIFAIFIAMAIGSFVQSLSNQRIAVKLMSSNDNASLALEQIIREVRVGYNFSSSPTAGTLSFINSSNENVTYSLNGSGQLVRKVGDKEDAITAGSATGVQISKFSPTHYCPSGANGPCMVHVLLEAEALDQGKVKATNVIETSVSSRIFGRVL